MVFQAAEPALLVECGMSAEQVLLVLGAESPVDVIAKLRALGLETPDEQPPPPVPPNTAEVSPVPPPHPEPINEDQLADFLSM